MTSVNVTEIRSFLINYYYTNLHFYISAGTLLHFCNLVSRYFCSPSFFCKATNAISKILRCSSFFWVFTVPSVLYPLHEVISFLPFFEVCTFFLMRPFSIVHAMSIVVVCTTCATCCLLRHCFISITTKSCWLKLTTLIHISHEVWSLTHGLSVDPGLPGSVDKAYTDRYHQLISVRLCQKPTWRWAITTSVRLTPLACEYNYLCKHH